MNDLWTKNFERDLRKFFNKFKCHKCGGDLYYFNSAVYNNPGLEAIYKCKKCGGVNYLMLGDCNGCKDCKSVPIEQVLAENEVDDYLENLAEKLEPKSHCCECVQGESHDVHIQYPNCKCEFTELDSEVIEK
jgi:hypothetical protein